MSGRKSSVGEDLARPRDDSDDSRESVSASSSNISMSKENSSSSMKDMVYVTPELKLLYLNEPFPIELSIQDARGREKSGIRKTVKINTYYADNGERVKGIIAPTSFELTGKEREEIKLTCLQPSSEHKNRPFEIRFFVPGALPFRSEKFSIDVKMKVIVLGNGRVGKTSFLNTFLSGGWSPQPSDNDQLWVMYTCRWQTVGYDDLTLQIWDRGEELGPEEEEKKKKSVALKVEELIYPNTDVFLVCFALNDRKSFENVQKWVAGIHAEISSPVVIGLVGLKKDLQDKPDKPSERISSSEGVQKQKEIKANFYIECSMKDKGACNSVFQEAVAAASSFKSPKQSRAMCRGGCEVCTIT